MSKTSFQVPRNLIVLSGTQSQPHQEEGDSHYFPKAALRVIGSSTGTRPAIATEPDFEERVDSSRIYPHLYDADQPGGAALQCLAQARKDVACAIAAYNAADLETVSVRLSQVASSAAKACALINFNPDLLAVVAFIRRAVLNSGADQISLGALNAMAGCLTQLGEQPALGLTQAAEHANFLELHGWDGQHQSLERLLTALLDDSDDEDEAQQGALFEILSGPAGNTT